MAFDSEAKIEAINCQNMLAEGVTQRDVLLKLRFYFQRRFATEYDINVDDDGLFIFAYKKYTNSNPGKQQVAERIVVALFKWKYKHLVPDFICSWYKAALLEHLKKAA